NPHSVAPGKDPSMPTTRIDLSVGGMTCSSCANRVEKKLNRMAGVEASVNYATEKATIFADPAIDIAELISTVEGTGYSASLPEAAEASPEEPEPEDVELASLRQRVIGAGILTIPVIAISMVPAWQF